MYDTGANARAFTEALGSEIAHFRRRRKMSREELADAAGISPSTMGRVEREGPKDVSDTWKLARALGVSLEDLIRRAEEGARLGTLDIAFSDVDVELDVQPGIERLDRARRDTRPAKTEDETQQLEDQAARDEDTGA